MPIRLLALSTLLLTAADHWTTYVCLRAPVDGWTVTEWNPLADWLFVQAGLVPGLMLDAGVTIAAVGFLLVTHRFSRRAKTGLLAFISASTAVAVVNNLGAISTLGLPLMG